MTTNKATHSGAVWRKCDLQIHTPRDPGWSGSPNLKGGSQEAEQARDQWADQFVAACLERNLSMIAITDHHDFAMIPYVRRAIERASASNLLWLFPGVEVTCQDSVQALVLFNCDSEPKEWRSLFGGHLQSISEPDEHAAKNPQAVPCKKDIVAFIEDIAKDSSIKDKLIILPHASNSGAHKSMLRQGFHIRFAEGKFDGVYIDKDFSRLDDITKKKIYGQIEQWGSIRRGIIPTGDNRKANFEHLGAHNCWIRVGEPTVEAIRQAVIADQARIAYSSPAYPKERVLEMSVHSTLTGSDFRIVFNDGYNCFIGGRGSGKTSILEYLRFGLGRSAVDLPEGEKMGGTEREAQLLAQTLSAEGKVNLKLDRNGVIEDWTRTFAARDTIQVTIGDVETYSIPAGRAAERFRARGFYQKQLSTIVATPSNADQQITGVAAAEQLEQRIKAEKAIGAAQRGVKDAARTLYQSWRVAAELDSVRSTVHDLERRLEAAKAKSTEAGLSPDAQEALALASPFQSAASAFSEAEEHLRNDRERIQKQLEAVPSLIERIDTSERERFGELETLLSAAGATRTKIRNLTRQIDEELAELEVKRLNLSTSFSEKNEEFQENLKSAQKQKESAQGIADEIEKISQELACSKKNERDLIQNLNDYKYADSNLSDSKTKLDENVAEIIDILSFAASKVDEMSNGTIKATAKKEDAPTEYIEVSRSLFDGLRIRDLPEKLIDLTQGLHGNSLPYSWNDFCEIIQELYYLKVRRNTGTIDENAPITKRLSQVLPFSLTEQALTGLFSKLDDDMVASILSARPRGFIRFEYKDNQNYIEFGKASPGQQASALLHLLLKQEAGTLIIDQPEDDLDNKVIMKVSELLRESKISRQLIFATHNPNLVVNGDADKVVCLVPGVSDEDEHPEARTARIEVLTDGAIETESVRLAITETMEGGRDAFELRSRKYQFVAR